MSLQLTVSHQSDDSVRGSAKIGRSAFAGDHPEQGDWSVRRKSKQSTEEEDPDLCVTTQSFLNIQYIESVST